MTTTEEQIDTIAKAVTETQEMIGHVVKHMVTKEEFAQLDGKVNQVITAVVNLQGDMSDVEEHMITREQFDEALTKEDAMMVILQRVDQERVATTAWIQRVENDVTMLKRHLHLA